MTRRNLLRHFVIGALAVLASGLRAQPAGALPAALRGPSEIVLHKGWVFRCTDLRDDVRTTGRV